MFGFRVFVAASKFGGTAFAGVPVLMCSLFSIALTPIMCRARPTPTTPTVGTDTPTLMALPTTRRPATVLAFTPGDRLATNHSTVALTAPAATSEHLLSIEARQVIREVARGVRWGLRIRGRRRAPSAMPHSVEAKHWRGQNSVLHFNVYYV